MLWLAGLRGNLNPLVSLPGADDFSFLAINNSFYIRIPETT
jgi:hypothetical protein